MTNEELVTTLALLGFIPYEEDEAEWSMVKNGLFVDYNNVFWDETPYYINDVGNYPTIKTDAQYVTTPEEVLEFIVKKLS